MSGAMAQHHAPPPSLAPESSATAAEARHEQVRQSLQQAGVTDKDVHKCVGGSIGCTQPIYIFNVMNDVSLVKYTVCRDVLCYVPSNCMIY